ILVSGFGTPVVYLFGLGVGLAAVVDAGSGAEIDGIGYLTFVAPALLVAATMMTATEEFTYPIMDGFKWRRMFYGHNATTISKNQHVYGLNAGSIVRQACGAVVT